MKKEKKETFYCESCDTEKPKEQHFIYQDYDYCIECIKMLDL